MGEKQLRLTGSEKVCSGNLEVGGIPVGELTGNQVRILITGHQNCYPFIRIGGTETANTFSHQPCFIILFGSGHDAERILSGFSKIVRLGQEMRVNIKFHVGVCIEDIQEIFRRTVVEIQAVHVLSAAFTQPFKRSELCTYEREDCLLLVTEIKGHVFL